MSWLQDMANENARLKAEQARAASSLGVPSPVVSQPDPVVSRVVDQLRPVVSKQAAWRARNLDAHRKRHADYMRKLRASARNPPSTASDAATGPTPADE